MSRQAELKANSSFDGASVVFNLPIDKALADPGKAQKFLDSLLSDSGSESSGNETEAADAAKENGKIKATYKAMTYEEYKAWMEAKLEDTQAMVDRSEYTQSAMDHDQQYRFRNTPV